MLKQFNAFCKKIQTKWNDDPDLIEHEAMVQRTLEKYGSKTVGNTGVPLSAIPPSALSATVMTSNVGDRILT